MKLIDKISTAIEENTYCYDEKRVKLAAQAALEVVLAELESDETIKVAQKKIPGGHGQAWVYTGEALKAVALKLKGAK